MERDVRLGIVMGTLQSSLKMSQFDVVYMIHDLLADDLRLQLVDESQPGIVRMRDSGDARRSQ